MDEVAESGEISEGGGVEDEEGDNLRGGDAVIPREILALLLCRWSLRCFVDEIRIQGNRRRLLDGLVAGAECPDEEDPAVEEDLEDAEEEGYESDDQWQAGVVAVGRKDLLGDLTKICHLEKKSDLRQFRPAFYFSFEDLNPGELLIHSIKFNSKVSSQISFLKESSISKTSPPRWPTTICSWVFPHDLSY
jgi:hypothetical protein